MTTVTQNGIDTVPGYYRDVSLRIKFAQYNGVFVTAGSLLFLCKAVVVRFCHCRRYRR